MNLKKMQVDCRRNCAIVGVFFLAIAIALTITAFFVNGTVQIAVIILCICLYFCALIAFLIILSIQYRTYEFMGHNIEAYLGNTTYILACDGEILDKHKALIVFSLTLYGIVDEHQVMLTVDPGMITPIISLYIDNAMRFDFK